MLLKWALKADTQGYYESINSHHTQYNQDTHGYYESVNNHHTQFNQLNYYFVEFYHDCGSYTAPRLKSAQNLEVTSYKPDSQLRHRSHTRPIVLAVLLHQAHNVTSRGIFPNFAYDNPFKSSKPNMFLLPCFGCHLIVIYNAKSLVLPWSFFQTPHRIMPVTMTFLKMFELWIGSWQLCGPFCCTRCILQ